MKTTQSDQARIESAAPELLEALVMAVKFTDLYSPRFKGARTDFPIPEPKWMPVARAAIAKATGTNCRPDKTIKSKGEINTQEDLYNWIQKQRFVLGTIPSNRSTWIQNQDTITGKGSAQFVITKLADLAVLLNELGDQFRYELFSNPQLGLWDVFVNFPRVNN